MSSTLSESSDSTGPLKERENAQPTRVPRCEQATGQVGLYERNRGGVVPARVRRKTGGKKKVLTAHIANQSQAQDLARTPLRATHTWVNSMTSIRTEAQLKETFKSRKGRRRSR